MMKNRTKIRDTITDATEDVVYNASWNSNLSDTWIIIYGISWRVTRDATINAAWNPTRNAINRELRTRNAML